MVVRLQNGSAQTVSFAADPGFKVGDKVRINAGVSTHALEWLLIVISVAGLVFGQDAARGEIEWQLRTLMGESGASAAQALLAIVNQ